MSDLNNIILNKYGDKCVGYWPLNGNTNDLKGGNHLSGGTAGTYVNGPDGEKAMLFNGTNQSLSTASTIDLTGTNKATLILFWYPNVYDLSNAEVVYELSANADATDGGILFIANGNVAEDPIRVGAYGNVGLNYKLYTDTTFKWSSPRWHCMAHVIDFSQAAASENLVYRNGFLITQSSASSTSNNTGNLGDQKLFVGALNNASLFANHSVSKIALFNDALTANQIKEISSYMRQGYSILNWMSYFENSEIKRGYRYGD